MKTLYLECSMGAAGDMLAAALLELLPDPRAFVDRLNSLEIPGVEYRAEPMETCGIQCTHMTVTVNGEEEESLDAGNGHRHDHGEEGHHHGHGEEGHHHGHGEEDHHHGHGEEGHHHGHGEEDHHHDHGHEEEDHHHGHGEEDHHHDHGHGDGDHHHGHGEEDHHHGHGEEGHHHDHGHGGEDHHHGHEGGRHSHHAHHSLHDIEQIVSHLNVPEPVRGDILAVYRMIAEAEGHVHGRKVEEIHFHEVGTMDAVADVTAVCLLMRELAPDRIIASPVHVGSGSVHCAHGILPVPAPATAYLLRDIPSYSGDVQGELCTPTGAALLRYFCQAYGAQPVMRVEKIGYGCGKKNFNRANCVRAMLGSSSESVEQVLELSCNLDDMTPEAVGFAMERLFSAGALDVYTSSIGMKKDRPGILLTCMCREDQREEMLRLLFLHTTTLGIRESTCRRYTLRRTTEVVETASGPVRVKKASGYGITREKAEYEDLARIARQEGIALAQAAGRIHTEKRN